MLGTSIAYVGDQPECSDYSQPTRLIKDVYEGRSIVALQ